MGNRTRKGNSRGVSLLEALVVLFLVSLASGLIFALVQAQAQFARQQSEQDRFIVGTVGLFNLLKRDLGSAYLVSETAGSNVTTISHLSPELAVGGDKVSNAVTRLHGYGVEEYPDTYRQRYYSYMSELGPHVSSNYRLNNSQLERVFGRVIDRWGNTAPTRETLLDGVNAAAVQVTDRLVTFSLTLDSQSRVLTLERVFYVPGLPVTP